MPLFWCEPTYLMSMAAIAVGLLLSVGNLLRRLRRARRNMRAGKKVTTWPAKLGMAIWLVAATLFLIELSFASFVEFTDAFSATNVSDRWFRRYVEPYRNQDGFRDRREFPKGEHTSTTDVYFFGDSFTIGQGIEEIEDLFVSRTEDLLNKGLPPAERTIRTFNAGEFGWEVSVIQGMIQAFFEKRVRPDVVVYVFMLNDIEGYDSRTQESIEAIQAEEAKSWIWTRTYFFNWLYFRWRQSRAQRTVDYFPHLADSYREEPWEGVRGKILRIKENCEANGADFRMVFFPFLHNLGQDYEFKHAHARLSQLCQENEIPFLDLEPLLTERSAEGLTVNLFDNHPNERCHRIVAEAIAAELLQDLTSDR